MTKDKRIKESQNLGYTIKQQRSRKTYDALITTGFSLLETRSFESITIAELAHVAGYSVGAFYSRFRSKDEYFDSMLLFHIAERLETNQRLCATHEPDELVEKLIVDMVIYYWEHRYFWHAALIRNTRDPEFWKPLRESGNVNVDIFNNYIHEKRGLALNDSEKMNIQFAFQITRGVINNTILNRPGPLFMEQKEFFDNLVRAFNLVSDYDNLFKV